jgi:uncharacterized protein YqgC (DUF456 family)
MNYFKRLWQAIPWSGLAQGAAILLVFLAIIGGVFLVAVGLPGTWVIVLASLGYSLFYPFDGGATSAYWVNGVLLGAAIFGEVVEFVVGTFGSKPLKVSNGAIWCALLGGLIGAIIGVPVFLVGALLGLFIGAFVGAFLYELFVLKSFGRALVNATAVLATRVVATFLKVTLALGMGIYLGFKIF